ncbi:MAG: hypothetical protein AB7S26_42755, partial [Sandaracinaceae bacterium]
TTIDLSRWSGDFEGFAGLLEILGKDGQLQKLRPNAIQSAFEVERTGCDIVLKPRQVGFTTWELARDVWFFLTRPGARVVVVCQSMADDSAINEIAEKLRLMFDALRAELGLAFPVRSAGGTRWVFPENRSSLRVVGAGASEASAKKKGRSGTIHRLHITELAFFEFAKQTLNAILECVPGPETGSEIVIESTANGAAGPFFERYQEAKAGRGAFRPHFFRWLDQAEYRSELEPGERIEPETPRERELVDKHGATPEQLKWYRKKVVDKGQDDADQEYPADEDTCWLAAGRLYFDRDRVRENHGKSTPPIETRTVGREGSLGQFRIWRLPQPGRRYVVIVDPSEGVGGDPSGIVILDRGSGEHVATIEGQFSTWECARVGADAGWLYAVLRRDGVREPALLAVERNNHGHAVLQALVREHRYPNIYVGRDKRLGWLTGPVSRANALSALHDAHREQHWSSPERETHQEMLHFIVPADGKPQAAPGTHDDLVLAHA